MKTATHGLDVILKLEVRPVPAHYIRKFVHRVVYRNPAQVQFHHLGIQRIGFRDDVRRRIINRPVLECQKPKEKQPAERYGGKQHQSGGDNPALRAGRRIHLIILIDSWTDFSHDTSK